MRKRVICVSSLLLSLLFAVDARADDERVVASRLASFWQRRAQIVHRPLLPRRWAVEAAAGGQLVLSDPQRVRVPLGLRLGLHFDQRWGLELAGEWVLAADRDERQALAVQSPASLKERPSWRATLAAIWSPWLGKISGGERLLAFEPYLLFGAGIVGTSTESEARIEAALRPEGVLALGLRLGRDRWLCRLELRQGLRLRPKESELEHSLGVALLVGVLLGGQTP